MMAMAKGNLQGKIGYTLHMFHFEDKAMAYYEKAYARGCTLPNVLAAYGLLLMRRDHAPAVEHRLSKPRPGLLEARQDRPRAGDLPQDL